MAAGKPVVATNIEGYNSVLTDGVEGRLVPPRDEKMLARALVSLLTDESLRQEMAARARLKAMEYSWEHVAQRVLNHYTRILSEPPWQKHLPKVEAIPV